MEAIMKYCNTCKTEKEFSEYHIRKASKDGLSAKCKHCAKEYDDARANDPKRVAARKFYAKTPEGLKAGAEAKTAWIASNPKKRAAQNAIANAIRSGRITKKPCEVCGSTYRIHAHHCDYDKFYDVQWLCAQHHKDWHKQHGEALNPF
jgi:hypothetical protein